jgi:hypothetical protein
MVIGGTDDLNYIEIQKAIGSFLNSWAELKKLSLLSTKKDFTSQIGEFIVAHLYGGMLAKNSIQKDWDVQLNNGHKIQVKSHAKASTNKNRWTPVQYTEDANIQIYIIIVFTEDYKLKHFFEVPWEILWSLSSKDKARRLIRWNKLKTFDKLQEADFCLNRIIHLFK